jgi:hypothetical protein
MIAIKVELLSTLASLFHRNYSRRQASGLVFEAILLTHRQALRIRPFHVLGDLSKPQTWSNTPMNQAFSRATPTHRE